MSSNNYLSLIQTFSNLRHKCSTLLINKLIYISLWCKCVASDDLFCYIVSLMFNTSNLKNTNQPGDLHTREIYMIDNKIKKLIPISKISYNFEIILEKYCGSNEIGINILKHISEIDQFRKCGIPLNNNNQCFKIFKSVDNIPYKERSLYDDFINRFPSLGLQKTINKPPKITAVVLDIKKLEYIIQQPDLMAMLINISKMEVIYNDMPMYLVSILIDGNVNMFLCCSKLKIDRPMELNMIDYQESIIDIDKYQKSLFYNIIDTKHNQIDVIMLRIYQKFMVSIMNINENVINYENHQLLLDVYHTKCQELTGITGQ